LYLRLFDGTNYGSCVDIFAPGEEVSSAGLARSDAMATFSGTSQATPLVSGAAAIYWSINNDATAQDIKDNLISTCTKDKLKINQVVPSSYQDTSPNCLLHISTSYPQPKPYRVYYSVSYTELTNVIKEMENNLYALVYIHSHQVNSSYYYSMIFKYMADVNFKTLMFSKSKRLMDAFTTLKQEGYQLTLIYDIENIDHIAVFERTDVKYSHVYRATSRRHQSMYELKSSQNETLISTSVNINHNNKLRYTSVYLVESTIATEHIPSVSISELSQIMQSQFSQGFFLSDLSSIPVDPPTISVVFTQKTEIPENYITFVELELEQAKKIVKSQLDKGITPLVIAGLNTEDGLKYFVSLKY